MNIIIAGASFPCGVRELGNVALRYGFTPTFIDHPHNGMCQDLLDNFFENYRDLWRPPFLVND